MEEFLRKNWLPIAAVALVVWIQTGGKLPIPKPAPELTGLAAELKQVFGKQPDRARAKADLARFAALHYAYAAVLNVRDEQSQAVFESSNSGKQLHDLRRALRVCVKGDSFLPDYPDLAATLKTHYAPLGTDAGPKTEAERAQWAAKALEMYEAAYRSWQAL